MAKQAQELGRGKQRDLAAAPAQERRETDELNGVAKSLFAKQQNATAVQILAAPVGRGNLAQGRDDVFCRPA
jgi:hypothetical protein